MIRVSDALRESITADSRRVKVKAVVKIVNPDIVPSSVVVDANEASYSVKSELISENTQTLPPIITLESNRWLLSGGYVSAADKGENARISLVCDAVSDENGYFATPQVITVYAPGLMTVFFPEIAEDGIARDFYVDTVGTGEYHEEFHDNQKTSVLLHGLGASKQTAMRITITRWSLPNRRVRINAVTLGVVETWTGDELAECELKQQGDFTGLAIPYGTCRLTMDNFDRRFEPRNKDGIFEAIEERQSIDMFLGVETKQGIVYSPVGVYYQYENGWKTGANKPTMTWDLVDIVGLLQDRIFSAIGTLPTTLDGWAGMLASQLGANFASRYSVDPDYANLPCAVDNVSAVYNVTCGQILIWICQATGTFARADAETGFLTFEPYWNEGVSLDLDNLESYPEMSANDDISLISFTLSDGTNVAWNGNSLAASKTASISNPFLHTVAQARKVAEQIITAHGGNRITTVGRGDFTSEIGDVATVQLDESRATTARVMEQNFAFRNGVLQGCQTRLLQATGGKLYDETLFFGEDSDWVCPDGVTAIRLTLGQGGQGGHYGEKGTLGASGVLAGGGVNAENGGRGKPGNGGQIWHGTVAVSPATTYHIHIGAGGVGGGGVGGHSTFGGYTSANGQVYPNGYTDILNGDSYGRSGVGSPLPNSSDGGIGGEGGAAGVGYWETLYWSDGRPSGYEFHVVEEPGMGLPGVAGGSGFCLIQYVRAGA